ncbi:DUF1513 domain-containing protein [Pseudothauera rhizosphaerae]|uniref:DUF1513 domain-containing protein n=1 Tax=Pseudothauera rhizosphaerae TaxID=2565932 RepID=UPI001454CD4B|nr:DUF1513 domain-containing protein [Pseudothauera rhizosphaerae]
MAPRPSRRRLLGALPAGLLFAHLPAPVRAALAAPEPALLTCWADSPTRPRRFFAGRSDAVAGAVELPERGHDIAWHPSGDGSAVVAARRPGRFLLRWDVAGGRRLAEFDVYDADEDIRLEGHLAFSRDGRLLFATESELIDGQGRVGVYDARTLERLASWPTAGIGPHAVFPLADGPLAVANGGILTLPETGRLKHNLDRMDPSLAVLDPADGRVLAQYRLPDPWMSVRHVAQAADGRIAVSLQNEAADAATPDYARPLFATVEDGALRYGAATPEALAACGPYAGDIAAVDGPAGTVFAVSCSVAGTLALWHADGRYVGHLPAPGVCALTVADGGLLATGDGGELWAVAAAEARTQARWPHAYAFDNHARPA